MPDQDTPETPMNHPAPPVVVIVGRPNVGKSALFNALLGRRLAIVAAEAGVTRDRLAAPVRVDDQSLLLVDTGGLGLHLGERADNMFDEMIREQAQVALSDATRVIFVVDGQAGLTPLDSEIAQLLRQRGQDVIVAVNKCDNETIAARAEEFRAMGFQRVLAISVLHQRQLSDLLDTVIEGLPKVAHREESRPRVAVVGRPNVGKSSIINRLLGEDRVMVSDIAGTTRDAIDVPVDLPTDGAPLPVMLVDTAGIRRRGKQDSAVEYFSVQRSEEAIKQADVVLFVMDASMSATAQDKRLASMIQEAGKACIILCNKWDLASQTIKQKELLERLETELPHMHYALRLTVCAVSGYNLQQIGGLVAALVERLRQSYPTALVNRVLQDAVQRLAPPTSSHGEFRVYYGVFRHNAPPTFTLFVNHEDRCRPNYLEYLRRCFHRSFGLEGLPIMLEMRRRRPDERVTRGHAAQAARTAAPRPPPGAEELDPKARVTQRGPRKSPIKRNGPPKLRGHNKVKPKAHSGRTTPGSTTPRSSKARPGGSARPGGARPGGSRPGAGAPKRRRPGN